MKLTKKSTLMRKSWREWTKFCGTGLPLTFSDLKVYCRVPGSSKSYFYYSTSTEIYVYNQEEGTWGFQSREQVQETLTGLGVEFLEKV